MEYHDRHLQLSRKGIAFPLIVVKTTKRDNDNKRIVYYKAEEPGCEVYLKNDAEGKYFPETEADGHPFKLMTGEDENEQIRLIRAIQEGKIKLEPKK